MQVIKKIYQALPLSQDFRAQVRGWKHEFKKRLPYRFQEPNPALRQFGTVQDLYPWCVGSDLDTRFYIQNIYSVYYPTLSTATTLTIWCYDESGREIARKELPLGQMQTHELSMREWMREEGRSGAQGTQQGTMMWHVALPRAIAANPECRDAHAYFTDRGYFAFVKNDEQVAFMHGIDRYAVFQKTETERFDNFYPTNETYSWYPEIPLGERLGCNQLDIMTLNRTAATAEIKLEIADAKQRVVKTFTRSVPTRGLFRVSLDLETLRALDNQGSMRATGLPTPWSRVMILRHFATGAISAMHC